MKIIIAPDSFKGTLSAMQAADAIEAGLKRSLASAEFSKVPMADGGEGTVQALVDASGGRIVECRVADPLGREISAGFGLMGDGQTAIIEMAAASGLPLLKSSERNPLLTTTIGTGQLIKSALDHGVKRVILGIGGSATVDGGAGMAQALGISLRDQYGVELPPGGAALATLASIDTRACDQRLTTTEFIVACDVDNPLLGAKGAARVYGPQKGATPEMVEQLEQSLANLAWIIARDLGIEVGELPGAGAAGGLGAGLVAFCQATLRPGIDIVIEAVRLESKIAQADLVVTGEGQIDYQTAYGKTLAGVARLAKKTAIPVIAIGGSLGEGWQQVHDCGIDICFSALPRPMNEEQIAAHAAEMLCQCSEQIGKFLYYFTVMNGQGAATG